MMKKHTERHGKVGAEVEADFHGLLNQVVDLQYHLRLSQTQVAKGAGTTQSAISDMLGRRTTEPRVGTLLAVLKTMGCTLQIVPQETLPDNEFVTPDALAAAHANLLAQNAPKQHVDRPEPLPAETFQPTDMLMALASALASQQHRDTYWQPTKIEMSPARYVELPTAALAQFSIQ